MLIAAMLFLVGCLIGRRFSAIILAMTSCVILFTATTIFLAVYGIDFLHVLITLGYLAAHQSGYLIGAYTGAPQESGGDGFGSLAQAPRSSPAFRALPGDALGRDGNLEAPSRTWDAKSDRHHHQTRRPA
jgi:hypothetical protein